MAYRTVTDIDAPAARVWQVWMDLERWPEWTPTMTSVTRLEKGMFRTGSSVRIKQPRLPEAVWRVSSLTPEKNFTWAARSGGVTTTARHVVTAREGGGCTAESHVVQRGPFAWMAKLFFGRLTKQYVEEEARGLKQRCEAEPSPES